MLISLEKDCQLVVLTSDLEYFSNLQAVPVGDRTTAIFFGAPAITLSRSSPNIEIFVNSICTK